MKVFITGAGLVGVYSALNLRNHGHSPVLFESQPNLDNLKRILPDANIITGDITNKNGLSKAVSDSNPDVIVHTAALRQRAAQADPERARQVNVGGTEAITRIAEQHGRIPLIHISLDTIYGTALTLTAQVSEDALLNPHSVYVETKVVAEEIALHYQKTIALRLTSLYGAWQGYTSTVNEILRTIIQSGLEKKDVSLEAPFPEPSEQTYIKDVADAVLEAINFPNTQHKVFNIGAGKLITYAEISQAIFGILGTHVQLYQAEGVRSQSRRTHPLDISRAEKELGYVPQWNLEKALRDYAGALRGWL